MIPGIIVAALGPGAPELLTLQAADTLQDPKYRVIFRTARHPVYDWLQSKGIPVESMDSFYDQYVDFDEMHQSMAQWLWQEAKQGPIALGVMEPEKDGLVSALQKSAPENCSLGILPGVSAASLCLTSLHEADSAGQAVQLLTATEFSSSSWNPSAPLLITELDSRILAGEVKLKLADLLEDEQSVYFFPPSEKPSRPALSIPLYQLDGQKRYDHTAAVYIPASDYLHRDHHTFEDLTRIVARLRAPDGCPWDRIQTHDSLRPYMVEEAWEAVNAMEDGDMDHLADELGDVLFQVFIHASIGQAFDEFTMTDILSGICRKMIHRHPHVFSLSHGETAEEISAGWEARKREETGSKTVGDTLNDVSQALPALKYSIKMHKKLAQLPALRRDPKEIAEEITQLSQSLYARDQLSSQAMGRLLRKCTELCYRTDQDAEILLHREVELLKRKYQKAENAIFAEEKTPEGLTFQQLRVYLDSVEGEIE